MKALIFSIIALGFVSLAGSLCAQEATEESAAASPASGRFLASTLSTFAVERTARNPFFPIGFVPSTSEAPAVVADLPPELPPDAIRVTSILMGDLPLAVINGREYARGEALVVTVENQQVDVLILEIGDGYILAGVRGRPPQRVEISR